MSGSSDRKLIALKFEAVAIGIAREKAVDAFNFVSIPGDGEAPCLDRFGRAADATDPKCKMATGKGIGIAAGNQVQVDGADPIPRAGEVEAFGAGDFLELQDAPIKSAG